MKPSLCRRGALSVTPWHQAARAGGSKAPASPTGLPVTPLQARLLQHLSLSILQEMPSTPFPLIVPLCG